MIRTPASITPLLRWLSTKHNLIDLAKKDFPASESIRTPAPITPLLRWLSTKHNLIDLAKKAFPASESKNTSKKG
jgi:hypothetical protein